jgi:hypothetical protein
VTLVRSVLPIALFALAGVLLGGAWSMRQQQASGKVVAVLIGTAVLAGLGGVAWLLPKGVL